MAGAGLAQRRRLARRSSVGRALGAATAGWRVSHRADATAAGAGRGRLRQRPAGPVRLRPVFAGALRLAAEPSAALPQTPFDTRERVGWVVLCVVLGAAALRAFVVPEAGWDAYSHWGLKAQAYALQGSIVDTRTTHEYYPPLVPLLEAWLYLHRGAASIDVGKTVWPVIGAAFGVCLAWHLTAGASGALAGAVCRGCHRAQQHAAARKLLDGPGGSGADDVSEPGDAGRLSVPAPARPRLARAPGDLRRGRGPDQVRRPAASGRRHRRPAGRIDAESARCCRDRPRSHCCLARSSASCPG